MHSICLTAQDQRGFSWAFDGGSGALNLIDFLGTIATLFHGENTSYLMGGWLTETHLLRVLASLL
jgi:hypothetical protein